MRPKIQGLIRVLVFTGRDMLIGFILGFSTMILLHKLNPRFPGIGLLAFLGLLAGFMKGLAKALLLAKLDVIAHDEFRKSYPKYKILGLWFVVLIGILTYSYGFNFIRWFTGPMDIISENIFLKNVAAGWWIALIITVFVTGLASHVLEPPKPNK